MTPIEWFDGALEDIERLNEFIAPKNPDAARRAALILIKAADLPANNHERVESLKK